MEIRALAERVLLATTLDEKLHAPSRLTDREPGARASVPEAPGRPVHLALRSGERPRVPGPHQLHSDEARASVLHALANHELLALELFALAILRFPDAPTGLRRAWAATILDEQRHLVAYRERLEACGGHLGQEPLSAFFWDALAGVDSPLGFVAGMEVGLEQANLDFARTWAGAFRQAGDEPTACVLDQVHADEVRHVRVGVRWLRRLKDPALTDWEAWTSALVFPLTPARGRGADLDREGRRRAGLDDDFVDRLAVTRLSRGRTPRVLQLDPFVEDRVAGRDAPDPALAADLAILAGLVARDGDVVVAERPPPAFLARLEAAGLPIPSFQLPGDRPGVVEPWGTHPGAPGWRAAFRDLYDKAWAARVLAGIDPGQAGTPCATLDQVEAAVAGRRVLVKAGLSTSGQHRIRVDGALTEAHRRWLAQALPGGEVVVEPTLDVALEVSGHVDVTERGPAWVGCVRFGASGGAFRGTWVGRWTSGLPTDVQRSLHEERVEARLREAALHVAQRAHALGFRGPLGIDAIVHAHGFKAISEVNPRWTLGRVSLELSRRVRGAWLFLPVRAIQAAGYADARAFCEGWPEAVPTNDPARATRLSTLLIPAGGAKEAAEAVVAALARAPGDVAALQRATAWLTEGCRPRPPRT